MLKRVTIFGVILSILFYTFPVNAAEAADFEALRQKYYISIIGDGNYDLNDPQVLSKIQAEDNATQKNWDSMLKDSNRSRIWEDCDLDRSLPGLGLHDTYSRIRTLAKSYARIGSKYYHNEALKDDIIGALKYLADNVYTEKIPYVKAGKINWYYWEIGAPTTMVDTLVLMYDELPEALLNDYIKALKHTLRSVKIIGFDGLAATGANLTWKCAVWIVTGVLAKDPAMIREAVDAFGDVFLYADVNDLEDGFYTDGSYLQHRFVPYAGGYGASTFSDTLGIVSFLADTPFAISQDNMKCIYDWAFNAFIPLLYNGNMMDMVRGREISRMTTTDASRGKSVIQILYKLAKISTGENKQELLSAIKRQVTATPELTNSFLAALPIEDLADGKKMLADNTISYNDKELAKVYPGMSRAIYNGKGFGFGISMFSKKIAPYEAHNLEHENKKAFNSSHGATYLYNDDVTHYSRNYWPTVDPYGFAGITVTDLKRPDEFMGYRYVSTKSWVGGTTLDDKYGAVGMELEDYIEYADKKPMTANKSWFMFDSQIVALGSAINAEDKAASVRTVVESRIIDSKDKITVDGVQKKFGEKFNISNSQYVHIEGQKANTGYYFPVKENINLVSEERQGAWRDINEKTYNTTDIKKNNFCTISVEHGKLPKDATYAYVILPNKTQSETAEYAKKPQIRILENSTKASGVQSDKLNLQAVNFWTDEECKVGRIKSNKKASVITQEINGELKIAVSDPTQEGTSMALEIESDKPDGIGEVISADQGITIVQTKPTVKLSINTNLSHGKTYRIAFKSAGGITSAPEKEVSQYEKAVKNMLVIKTGSNMFLKHGKAEVIYPESPAVMPIMENDTALVPIRFIVEQLGADVSWDNNTRKVSITSKNGTAELYIGRSETVINGQSFGLGAAALMQDGRTYIPIRVIAEKLFKTSVRYANGMIVIGDKLEDLNDEAFDYIHQTLEAGATK